MQRGGMQRGGMQRGGMQRGRMQRGGMQRRREARWHTHVRVSGETTTKSKAVKLRPPDGREAR